MLLAFARHEAVARRRARRRADAPSAVDGLRRARRPRRRRDGRAHRARPEPRRRPAAPRPRRRHHRARHRPGPRDAPGAGPRLRPADDPRACRCRAGRGRPRRRCPVGSASALRQTRGDPGRRPRRRRRRVRRLRRPAGLPRSAPDEDAAGDPRGERPPRAGQPGRCPLHPARRRGGGRHAPGLGGGSASRCARRSPRSTGRRPRGEARAAFGLAPTGRSCWSSAARRVRSGSTPRCPRRCRGCWTPASRCCTPSGRRNIDAVTRLGPRRTSRCPTWTGWTWPTRPPTWWSAAAAR